MSKKAVRVSVSAVVILSALTWLMISTISEGAEYYKKVDEVMADPSAWHGKRLQVHGFVLGDPMVKSSTLEYRFTVTDPTTFVRPWTASVPYLRTDEQPFEYACHEGNYGMEGILSGARAEEAKK